MADILTGLTQFLLNDPGVSDLIQNRIYPLEASKGAAPPYLTFKRLSTQRVKTLLGNTGLTSTRIQLNCRGKSSLSFTDASGLADAVRNATGGTAGVPDDSSPTSRTNKLDGFRGTMSGIRVFRSYVIDAIDERSGSAGGEITALVGTILDLMIWWDEGT